MKIRSFVLAVALAGAPALLGAQQTQPQQGAAREHGEGHGRRGGWQQGARRPGAGIQRLIARREELHLSNDQVSRLQAIDQRLQSQDKPLEDRLRALFQQSGLPDFRARRAEGGQRAQGQQGQRRERPQLTEQQRQQLQRLREQAQPIREQLRQNHQAAMRDVQAVLTDAQKQQLRQLRQQHQGRRGQRGEGRHGRRPQGQQQPGAQGRTPGA